MGNNSHIQKVRLKSMIDDFSCLCRVPLVGRFAFDTCVVELMVLDVSSMSTQCSFLLMYIPILGGDCSGIVKINLNFITRECYLKVVTRLFYGSIYSMQYLMFVLLVHSKTKHTLITYYMIMKIVVWHTVQNWCL